MGKGLRGCGGGAATMYGNQNMYLFLYAKCIFNVKGPFHGGIFTFFALCVCVCVVCVFVWVRVVDNDVREIHVLPYFRDVIQQCHYITFFFWSVSLHFR